MRINAGIWLIVATLVLGCSGPFVHAHPLLEDAVDVVIGRELITIDARVAAEEVLLAEASGASRVPADQWPGLLEKHRAYLSKHFTLKADGVLLTARSVELIDPGRLVGKEPSPSMLMGFRLQYPVSKRPTTIQLDQSILRELNAWSVSCVLRIRQSDEDTFQSMLLTADKSAEFTCEWKQGEQPTTSPTTQSASVGTIRTNVQVWPTIRAYLHEGIMHILKGRDHLLFVSALVLAASGLWDLIKVVSAFTAAHTLTLALSVFNVVTLSERIVEPMIAASIIFVAVQNIFWPKQSRGWTRLGIAFGFGLFHGLGFAGCLKEAMSEMPPAALWAALAAFSVGVEIGHQIVVVPLFTLLAAGKHLGAELPRLALARRTRQLGSMAIVIGGIYFFIAAIRGPV